MRLNQKCSCQKILVEKCVFDETRTVKNYSRSLLIKGIADYFREDEFHSIKQSEICGTMSDLHVVLLIIRPTDLIHDSCHVCFHIIMQNRHAISAGGVNKN